jgi:hypothetical protein
MSYQNFYLASYRYAFRGYTHCQRRNVSFNLTLPPHSLNNLVSLQGSLLRVIFRLISRSLRNRRISQALCLIISKARVLVFGCREYFVYIGILPNPKAEYMP